MGTAREEENRQAKKTLNGAKINKSQRGGGKRGQRGGNVQTLFHGLGKSNPFLLKLSSKGANLNKRENQKPCSPSQGGS